MAVRLILGNRPKENFNIFVVGEDGCGKSTFHSSLLRKYTTGLPYRTDIRFSSNIRKVGSCQVDAECVINLFETKGYGDSRDYVQQILQIKDELIQAHVEWNSMQWNLLSEQNLKECDGRIHCLFYLIEPHHISNKDVFFLTEISDVAPIVPVIVKSDTMTMPEREEFLIRLKNQISAIEMAKDVKSVVYHFGEDQSSGGRTPTKSTSLEHSYMTVTSKIELSDTKPRPAREPSTVREKSEEGGSVSGTPLSSHGVKGGVGIEGSGMLLSACTASTTSATAFASAYSSSDEEGDFIAAGQRNRHGIANPKRSWPTAETVNSDDSIQASVGDESKHASAALTSDGALPRVADIFAVVCSNASDAVRRYPWGAVNSEDEGVCDFRRLQRLVFESGNISEMRTLSQRISIRIAADLRCTSQAAVGFDADGGGIHVLGSDTDTAANPITTTATATRRTTDGPMAAATFTTTATPVLDPRVPASSQSALLHDCEGSLHCHRTPGRGEGGATHGAEQCQQRYLQDTQHANDELVANGLTEPPARARPTAETMADTAGAFLRHPAALSISRLGASVPATSSHGAAGPASADLAGSLAEQYARLPLGPLTLTALLCTILLYSPVRTLEWFWSTAVDVAVELWQVPWYLLTATALLLLAIFSYRLILLW